jgi:hypothetical protein
VTHESSVVMHIFCSTTGRSTAQPGSFQKFGTMS